MAVAGCGCLGRPAVDSVGRPGGHSTAFRQKHAPQRVALRTQQCRRTASGDVSWPRQQRVPAMLAGAPEADLDSLQMLDGSSAAAPPQPDATEPPPQFPQRVTRLLWDSVRRPLLRVGKSGVQASHITSLGELLGAHGLVKVQLNAVHSDVHATGQELATGTGGTLVQVKGRTLLLGAPQHDEHQLLAVAERSTGRAEAAADRKVAAREQRQTAQLTVGVEAKLRSLISGNVVGPTDFDSHSLRALAGLPEQVALAVLQNCTKARLRGVRNRSAWLTSQCRRLSDGAARTAGSR